MKGLGASLSRQAIEDNEHATRPAQCSEKIFFQRGDICEWAIDERVLCQLRPVGNVEGVLCVPLGLSTVPAIDTNLRVFTGRQDANPAFDAAIWHAMHVSIPGEADDEFVVDLFKQEAFDACRWAWGLPGGEGAAFEFTGGNLVERMALNDV